MATSGRAGPVLLDFPEDVVHGEHSFDSAEFRIEEATTRAPSRRSRPAASDTERAAKHLASARRPLLLVGGGVHLSGAHAELAALARQEAIPVAHTMSGKGSMACTDPLSVGLFGRFDRIANGLIAGSDCLLVVGCKLGEIATKRFTLMPQGVPLIHLDILGEEFGRTTEPDVALCGDASEGLRDLLAALEDGAAQRRLERQPYLAEVERRKEGWQVLAQPRYTSAEVPVNMGRLIGELRRALPAQGIVVADGGFAAHWTGLLFDTQVAGRNYVANRGLASIGYGLPGAVGAKLARPDVPVVAITGDGGFNMTLGDLETARRVGADVVIVVVNNAASGYVKSLQHSMYGPGNYQSSDLVEMDYARIAESMGCRGLRVQTPDALSTAFATALAVRGSPTVIDVCVTRDPGQMLPATDSRAMKVTPGDRPV